MPKSTVGVYVALLHGLYWYLPTLNLWITDEPSLAGTHWPMGSNDAECVDAAGSRHVAEILTLTVVTRLSG